MGKARHSLDTFLGLGTGLANFCVAVSCFVPMVYKSVNLTNCVRFAAMIAHHHATLASGGWSTFPGKLVLQGIYKLLGATVLRTRSGCFGVSALLLAIADPPPGGRRLPESRTYRQTGISSIPRLPPFSVFPQRDRPRHRK